MSDRTLERQLEWEPATEPIILEHVEWPVPPFIAGMRRLTIQRDEELRLHLLAEGVLADKTELRRRHEESGQVPAGTFFDQDDIAFDAHGARCALSAFLVDTPDATISTDGQVRFRQKGQVDRLVRTWSQKFSAEGEHPALEALGPPAWCSDWFINGPHDPLFMRSTKRRRQATFARQREFGSVTLPEAVKEMLLALGIERSKVTAEIGAMNECRLTKTNSRQVLGSMLDFANMLEVYLDGRPLLDVALHLAAAPCRPLKMDRPKDVARELFAGPAMRLGKS